MARASPELWRKHADAIPFLSEIKVVRVGVANDPIAPALEASDADDENDIAAAAQKRALIGSWACKHISCSFEGPKQMMVMKHKGGYTRDGKQEGSVAHKCGYVHRRRGVADPSMGGRIQQAPKKEPTCVCTCRHAKDI
jgi:hypothetical protein